MFIHLSESDTVFLELSILTCSSISDQRFMLPFITVALVSDSFAIGKYPYKPAMSFMREQIPKSLSFGWFWLSDLQPRTLEEAIMTLARNMGTDGRSTATGALVHRDP